MPVYKEVVAHVKRKVGEDTYIAMCAFVEQESPKLYGTKQPRGFHKATTTLVLYHDLTGMGWTQMERIKEAPIKVAHSTLSHNAKEIRRTLRGWAVQQVTPGTPREWRAAARDSRLPKIVSDTTLEIDSFDLAIEKEGKKRGRKSEYWSGKLVRPGWRFMLVIDLSGKIHLMSSGYSPKIYDGHWF